MALRDWIEQTPVAVAVPAVPAVEAEALKNPNPGGVAVAKVAVSAVFTGDSQGANHQAEVDITTPTGPRTLRIVHFGEPTLAEIDTADAMLGFVAEQSSPVPEADIIGAVDADPILARNILYRLSVDGIVEPLPGGFFQIPDFPPAPANLPEGCPLTGAAFPETGCRFHRKLFNTLWKQGALPLPNGGCPLRAVCKLGRPE